MKMLIRVFNNYNISVLKKYTDFYGKKKGTSLYKNIKFKCYLGYIVSVFLLPLMITYGSSVLFSVLIEIVLIACFTFLPESVIKNRIKVLRLSFGIDMPDFLENMALLLDAGQNLWEAIERAAIANEDDNSLYGEIYRTIKEIKGRGGSEKDPCEAFSEMAKRCSSSQVSSFVSLIVQNSRKGSSELVEIIRIQSAICRNERKNMAKKLGEEATTLMLIPSTILFIAILIMLLTPAFMALYSL